MRSAFAVATEGESGRTGTRRRQGDEFVSVSPLAPEWSIRVATDDQIGNHTPAISELRFLRQGALIEITVSDLARSCCQITGCGSSKVQQTAGTLRHHAAAARGVPPSVLRMLAALPQRQAEANGLRFATATADAGSVTRFAQTVLKDDAFACRRALYVDHFVADGMYNFLPLVHAATASSRGTFDDITAATHYHGATWDGRDDLSAAACSHLGGIDKQQQSWLATPIFVAAALARVSVCTALLQYGVKIDVPHRPPVALCVAVLQNTLGVASGRGSGGFSVPRTLNHERSTMRDFAELGDDEYSVNGAMDSEEEGDDFGDSSRVKAMRREAWTPLLAAAQAGSVRIVWLLLVHSHRARQQHMATDLCQTEHEEVRFCSLLLLNWL